MRIDLRERLASGRALVVDGATGTQLQARGLPAGACSEGWNLDHPDAVRAVAAAYAAAGSDLVYSNSFGGNPWRLAHHGLEGELAALNRRAAELAREGVGDDVYVAGSMGPTGDFLAPLGLLEPAAVEAAYGQQAAALVAGGADAIVCETFAALDELSAAVRGARAAVEVPIVASLTYGRGGRTMMGVTATDAVLALVEAGAEVIGLNCGDDLEVVPLVLAAYRATVPELPVLIKPNAGMPAIVAGTPVWPVAPAEFGQLAAGWRAAGATLLGGCCGTSPEHLAAVAAAVRR
ncbi:MAG: homocysteine S-methyltransferase family protein [Fimbriimonadaceae bacterium]|nr:homocysteine S-methyltransferase family protein [Fimbriimonadaceae bacterium]